MNKIIDERLEELAYASIYTNVTGEEIRSIAAELLAARERIRTDEVELEEWRQRFDRDWERGYSGDYDD